MTVLLADELPPVDLQSAMLSQALDDAIAWRTHEDRPCAQCDELWDDQCGQCTADYDQADRYHELARALGVVGDAHAPLRARMTGQQRTSMRAPRSHTMLFHVAAARAVPGWLPTRSCVTARCPSPSWA